MPSIDVGARGLRARTVGWFASRAFQQSALLAGSGVGMLLLFLLVKDGLTDDAYITLAYAKNLALHLHWGLIPHEVANTATSPLNVLLLAGVTALTRLGGGAHAVLALGIVSVGLAMTMAWGWIRIVRALRLPFAAAWLGVALVLVNPLLLSAVGLEVLLISALLVAMLATALEGRAGWFGVIAGLSLLARLDLIVFVLLVALATEAIRDRWARAMVGAALVAAPWFLVSWVFLGSAVPDTLVIKTSDRGWGYWSYVTGPVMYAIRWPFAAGLALAPAVAGAFGWAGWMTIRASVRGAAPGAFRPLRPVAAVGAGGVVYYLVYSLLGLPPYHWYYVAPAASLSIFLVVGAAAWLTLARQRVELRQAAPTLALVLAGVLALANLAVDLRHGIPWRAPAVTTNWASAADYARIGRALRHRIGNATVASPGETGALAYYCSCPIVDEFSDRGDFIPLVNRHIAHGRPVSRLLYRLNYLWLDRSQRARPVDYVLRYESGPGSGQDVWQVSSPWRHVGHFRLLPVPRPSI